MHLLKPPPTQNRGPPWCRPRFETLDYIIVSNRWTNGVINVEAVLSAHITTDHFPLTATLRFKLKKNSNVHNTGRSNINH